MAEHKQYEGLTLDVPKTEEVMRTYMQTKSTTPTKREREILHLIADELTSREIAEQLFISAETVLTHRKNLLSKLNAKNTAGLMRRAYDRRLLVLG